MKRIFGFSKELVDGFCECAECGKKIYGRQWYDLKNEEFICEECFGKIETQKTHDLNENVGSLLKTIDPAWY